MRTLIRHRQPVIHNLTRGKWIKGNVMKDAVIPTNAVVKSFTITPGQISVSSAGYRLSPAAGVLAPDAAFGGGNIILFQANDNDTLRVQNTGGVQFPGISGDLYVRIGPYIGPGRIVLHWDIDLYSATVPGIYNYMVDQIALATGMIISADPVA